MLEIIGLQPIGLSPLSLNVAAGACVTLSGPSGAGKSLLLRAIADLDPHGGTIRLDGSDRQDLAAPDWRRQVAYLPAESGWWGEIVDEHFESWDRAEPLIVELGLDPACRTWPVSRLSSGERHRLALARALALAPRVLLLDEPTGPLDPTTTAAAETIVGQCRDDGAAVLWVTHDPAQAERVGQRHYRIVEGTLREAAP